MKPNANMGRQLLLQTIAKTVLPPEIRNCIRDLRIPLMFKLIYRNELNTFIKQSNVLSNGKLKTHMKENNLSCKWAGIYSFFNNIHSREYIPEDFFHVRVENAMNNMKVCAAYEDKNSYDKTPLKSFCPGAVLRRISGCYYSSEYIILTEKEAEKLIEACKSELIAKPSIESGSGRGIFVGHSKEILAYINAIEPVKDIIVQPYLNNSRFFSKFNKGSFNTLRCITAFTGTEYVVLGSALRIGRSSSRVDNQNAGGLVIGLSDSGHLADFAVDKQFNKYKSHPDTGILFQGEVVVEYRRIKQTCIEMHKNFPHFGLVSWDVSIDNEERVRIIEMNLNWHGINIIQLFSGPLFGEYKNEIFRHYAIPELKSWQ